MESEDGFCRLEELTPEEKLLRSIKAPDGGTDIEGTWEACCRREFEEMMESRMRGQKDDPDKPPNLEQSL
jgi:hypothetical protein